jgi:hypothetical protein
MPDVGKHNKCERYCRSMTKSSSATLDDDGRVSVQVQCFARGRVGQRLRRYIPPASVVHRIRALPPKSLFDALFPRGDRHGSRCNR